MKPAWGHTSFACHPPGRLQALDTVNFWLAWVDWEELDVLQQSPRSLQGRFRPGTDVRSEAGERALPRPFARASLCIYSLYWVVINY